MGARDLTLVLEATPDCRRDVLAGKSSAIGAVLFAISYSRVWRTIRQIA